MKLNLHIKIFAGTNTYPMKCELSLHNVPTRKCVRTAFHELIQYSYSTKSNLPSIHFSVPMLSIEC